MPKLAPREAIWKNGENEKRWKGGFIGLPLNVPCLCRRGDAADGRDVLQDSCMQLLPCFLARWSGESAEKNEELRNFKIMLTNNHASHS